MRHKLYFGQGSSIEIHADSPKEAIAKFRKWCPDVVFMTGVDLAREQARQAALKVKIEALPVVPEEAAEALPMAAE